MGEDEAAGLLTAVAALRRAASVPVAAVGESPRARATAGRIASAARSRSAFLDALRRVRVAGQGFESTEPAQTRLLAELGATRLREAALEAGARRVREQRQARAASVLLGLPARFGRDSLLLPERLLGLADDLQLSVFMDLDAESEQNVTLYFETSFLCEVKFGGEHVALELTITKMGSATATTSSATSDEEEHGYTRALEEEKKDILVALLKRDTEENYGSLCSKIRALVDRAQLENELPGDISTDYLLPLENAVRSCGFQVSRAGKGVEVKLPALKVVKDFLKRNHPNASIASLDEFSSMKLVEQSDEERQRITFGLIKTDKSSNSQSWQDCVSLVVMLDPPLEMTNSMWRRFRNEAVEANSDDAQEGAALASLFSEDRLQPIGFNVLRKPTAIQVNLFDSISIQVDVGRDEQRKVDACAIVSEFVLPFKELEHLPKLVHAIFQQVRFNALLASIVCRKNIVDLEVLERSGKQPRTSSTKSMSLLHKCTLMCAAREKRMRIAGQGFQRNTRAAVSTNDPLNESAGNARMTFHLCVRAPNRFEFLDTNGKPQAAVVVPQSGGALEAEYRDAAILAEKPSLAVFISNS